MKLDHLTLNQLKLSPVNVRKKGGKEVDDLVPSIRSLGIIQPLLVRPNCEGFEIVAGQRRFHALTRLAEEGITEPLPCIIMEEGDDAKAIEASLAENVARLPMDEIDQYKAFATLAGKGETIPDIAARFGVSERLVSQRLAIAGIIPPILNAYRREEIRPDTLRILTMATPRQQKAWWTLFKSEDDYAPVGRSLKDWLFGGTQIPVSNALFDLAEYDGSIISDLFGEERYFDDANAFWNLQGKAIAAMRDAYLADGWAEVVVLEIGYYWQSWEHTKTPKKKGGKVFITTTRDGEVTCHEGWLTSKEARREDKESAAGAQAEAKAERPELTKAMDNYLGLHRHAAVRTELLSQPGIALRLALAHMICGSGLWNVRPEGGRADNQAIADSLASAKATETFTQERQAVAAMLGIALDEDDSIVSPYAFGGPNMEDILPVLLGMEDQAVMRVLTFVMTETLEAHHPVIAMLGELLSLDMRSWWSPEDTFFDLLRDKSAINAMVRELAGDNAADAHVASTAKVQKKIIADCLNGTRAAHVETWLPRYLEFPARSYRN